MVKQLKPFQQGDLDGLCGYYSAINALRLINPKIGWSDCYELTKEWLPMLEEKRGYFAQMATIGLYMPDLNFILTLIANEYGIKKKRPFCRNSRASLDEYWTAMKDFLDEAPHRAIVFGYYTETASHWTVAKRLTKKTIWLFDSSREKVLRKSLLTTGKINYDKPIGLSPALTFFLQKTPSNE